MKMIEERHYAEADQMISALLQKTGIDFSAGRDNLAELMEDVLNGHCDHQTTFDPVLGLRDFRFIQEDEYDNGRDDEFADMDDDEFAFVWGHYFFWV